MFLELPAPNKNAVIVNSNEVPETVVKPVKEAYPSASSVRFSTLESGKIYQADFEVDGRRVSLRSNKTQILNSFEELDPTTLLAVSKSLDGLDIGGRIVELNTGDYRALCCYNEIWSLLHTCFITRNVQGP